MSRLPLSLLPDSATVVDGGLHVGGCDVARLANEYGTPVFIYDESHLRRRAAETVALFGSGAVYASKAFLCKAMARLAHEEGMRIDVSTGGELHVALAAGVPADALVMHGNNKSRRELEMALDAEVGRLVVDSHDEMTRVEQLVAQGHPVPDVFVRVSPGVEAHTHEYVTTGLTDSKFGFPVETGAAHDAVVRAAASPAMRLRGIHAHIGSQVFRSDSFAGAVDVLAGFARPFGLPELVIGGGLGVPYVEGESAPSITEWGSAILERAGELGLSEELWVEPGRAIVAGAAITVYEVGTIKEIPGVRTYVAVDGGMSDNPRPVLYGSGYEVFRVRDVEADRPLAVRLVGKHCESGDVLVWDGRLPADLAVGDLVATPVTGAYGHSMGSNYNKVLRPPVVFVKDGQHRPVIRRETYDDLLDTDLG